MRTMCIIMNGNVKLAQVESNQRSSNTFSNLKTRKHKELEKPFQDAIEQNGKGKRKIKHQKELKVTSL